MEFEWDEDKRRSNIAKHGIDFIRAKDIFDGRLRVDVDSSRHSEQRVMSISVLDSVHVAAIWTERGNRIRFISVRDAHRSERTLYQRMIQMQLDGSG